MIGLVVQPGEPGTTAVAELPDPRPAGDELLLRTLEVGVCGTDREISEGEFGVAPDDGGRLVLGHEFLGVVEQDGHGFTRGDVVASTVRRSCGHCGACEEGSPDACYTGDYRERGITRLNGFASELAVESAEHLVAVPRSLGRLGVLTEPASICARGIRHARAVGERQPWRAERALVIGTGAIGMLTTCFLRLEGFDVTTAGLAPANPLVEAVGAAYVDSSQRPLAELVEADDGFDLIVEAVGDAQVMLDVLGLLRRDGVGCLLGVDGARRPVSIEGHVVGVDVDPSEPRADRQRERSRARLDARGGAARRHPLTLARLCSTRFVGLRVPVDRFEEAFAFDGVKATLEFSGRLTGAWEAHTSTPSTSVRATRRSASSTATSATEPGASVPSSGRPASRAGARVAALTAAASGARPATSRRTLASSAPTLPASVPPGRRARPPLTSTSIPPRAKRPSPMPAASIASLTRQSREPAARCTTATVSGARCTPSTIAVTITSSRASAAPAGPGSRGAKRRCPLWMCVIAPAPRSKAACAVAASASVCPIRTPTPRATSVSTSSSPPGSSGASVTAPTGPAASSSSASARSGARRCSLG